MPALSSTRKRLDELEAQAYGAEFDAEAVDDEFTAAVGRLPWQELGAFADAIAADLNGTEISAETEALADAAWQKLCNEVGAERIAQLFAD